MESVGNSDDKAFIVENCPVTMTDAVLCKAIEDNWGKTSAFTRMRFLDSKLKVKRPSAARVTPSTGKVLFRLEDPSRLLEVLVPRCRKGHVFSSTPIADTPCTLGDCNTICRKGTSDGLACYESTCNFVACNKCIVPLSRVPLRVPHGDLMIPLKVKRARGTLTFPKKQNQLFIHAFPLDSGTTSQDFVKILVKKLGFREEAEMSCSSTSTIEIENLEQLVETRGLYVSNLIAFAVAQLFSLPEVLGTLPSDEANNLMQQLASDIQHYVIDLSESTIHPKPFCFFLEMVDVASAVKVKNLLHDVTFNLDNLRMVLDVQYRGDDKVRKGSILNQNKTVPESKYEEAKANAISQVKKYMNDIASGTLPEKPKRLGLNTGATPFQPAITIPMPNVGIPADYDPSVSVFEYVSMQVAAVKEENSYLALDPLIASRLEGKLDIYEDLVQQKQQELGEQIIKQNRKQRAQIDVLQEKINSLTISRDMELVMRNYQLNNIQGMLRDAISLVPASVQRNRKVSPTKDSFLWDLEGWGTREPTSTASGDPWTPLDT